MNPAGPPDEAPRPGGSATPVEQQLGYRRLRAPKSDRQLLVEPREIPLDALLAQARGLKFAAPLAAVDLAELRALARAEVYEAARRYTAGYLAPSALAAAAGDVLERPWILAGHQPQMFHPGVWCKNFGLHAVATQAQGVALNLVVDNDTLKTAALPVPGGSPHDPQVEAIAFDQARGELPFEERSVLDGRLAATFAERLTGHLAPLVRDPLVGSFWPRVLARLAEHDRWGLALAQARHQLEADWGLRTLEVPLSQVCGTRAFRRWMLAVCAEGPRLRAIHNQALAEYRRVNHIRSRHHPVPELSADGPWCEVPFWIWTTADPRRRRLFTRREADRLWLTDRGAVTFSVPWPGSGSADDALAELDRRERGGVRLRTRALTTTLFARTVLGDLFVHGIGGAKYDELTDELVRRFLGGPAGPYLVLTATLQLPIPRPRPSVPSPRELTRRLRELAYHPERVLDPGQIEDPALRRQAQSLVEAKARWIALEPTPERARERCRAIRELNETLGQWLAGERARWQLQQPASQAGARAERVLSSREYAFPLYPEGTLREFLLEISSRRF